MSLSAFYAELNNQLILNFLSIYFKNHIIIPQYYDINFISYTLITIPIHNTFKQNKKSMAT